MYESGYYPPGAEHDPRAPWNCPEHHIAKCEACNGKGYHWYAYNFEMDIEKQCTEETWCALPATEEEACKSRVHYIQGAKETCEVCNGTGEVEDNFHYNDWL